MLERTRHREGRGPRRRPEAAHCAYTAPPPIQFPRARTMAVVVAIALAVPAATNACKRPGFF